MANSRRKGHTFERGICRDLREWLGREWLVQRNLDDDQTGARGRAGDVLVSGPHLWPFSIECKAGYRVRSSHLWKGSRTLESHWSQATDQASAVSLEPLLLLKPEETGHPVLVFLRRPVRRVLRIPGPAMLVELQEEPVAVSLWTRLLELEPVALLAEALWSDDRRASPAAVAEEVAGALQELLPGPVSEYRSER